MRERKKSFTRARREIDIKGNRYAENEVAQRRQKALQGYGLWKDQENESLQEPYPYQEDVEEKAAAASAH